MRLYHNKKTGEIVVCSEGIIKFKTFGCKNYAEFLSQFEFESETVYQETNDYSDINSGITITK